MPYSVRRSGKGYAIQRRLPGGRTRTVGRSSSRAKAQASVRARYAAERGQPTRRR